jgi:hypothetical protein
VNALVIQLLWFVLINYEIENSERDSGGRFCLLFFEQNTSELIQNAFHKRSSAFDCKRNSRLENISRFCKKFVGGEQFHPTVCDSLLSMLFPKAFCFSYVISPYICISFAEIMTRMILKYVTLPRRIVILTSKY